VFESLVESSLLPFFGCNQDCNQLHLQPISLKTGPDRPVATGRQRPVSLHYPPVGPQESTGLYNLLAIDLPHEVKWPGRAGPGPLPNNQSNQLCGPGLGLLVGLVPPENPPTRCPDAEPTPKPSPMPSNTSPALNVRGSPTSA
jgi:hypothetical protein